MDLVLQAAVFTDCCLFVCLLFNDAVSIDDRMINEYGAVGGMNFSGEPKHSEKRNPRGLRGIAVLVLVKQ
jgi:hypothetical protein